MERKSLTLPVLTLLIASGISLAGCGGSTQPGTGAGDSTKDSTSINSPAPDNNSANNPSLADTNYEKDRTRPITDTMKRDTVHRR